MKETNQENKMLNWEIKILKTGKQTNKQTSK